MLHARRRRDLIKGDSPDGREEGAREGEEDTPARPEVGGGASTPLCAPPRWVDCARHSAAAPSGCHTWPTSLTPPRDTHKPRMPRLAGGNGGDDPRKTPNANWSKEGAARNFLLRRHHGRYGRLRRRPCAPRPERQHRSSDSMTAIIFSVKACAPRGPRPGTQSKPPRSIRGQQLSVGLGKGQARTYVSRGYGPRRAFGYRTLV